MASVCPGRNVAFCSEHSPTILEDNGDGFLAQTDCDTLRFLQSLSSCQVRQGYWIGQPISETEKTEWKCFSRTQNVVSEPASIFVAQLTYPKFVRHIVRFWVPLPQFSTNCIKACCIPSPTCSNSSSAPALTKRSLILHNHPKKTLLFHMAYNLHSVWPCPAFRSPPTGYSEMPSAASGVVAIPESVGQGCRKTVACGFSSHRLVQKPRSQASHSFPTRPSNSCLLCSDS